MKKRVVVFVVVVLLPAVAAADIYLRPDAAYAFPTGKPYASRAGVGLAAGWSWNPRFALELGFRFWPVPVSGTADGLSRGVLHVLPAELSLHARLPLGSKLHLRGEAGAGWAFHSFALDPDVFDSWNALGFSLDESAKDGPAVHVGASLEYTLTPKMAVDFGIRWHLLRTTGTWSIVDDDSAITQTGTVANLNFDAVTLSLGLKIALFLPEKP